MAEPALKPEEVRTYLQDRPENNYLLDGLEFSDPQVNLAIEMAIDEFNSIPPSSITGSITNFPSKVVLLYGTCYHLLLGSAQLLARNTMEYSDGGVQIPIEERAPLYSQMASSFQQLFQSRAEQVKRTMNLNSGWGSVNSDEIFFPDW